MNKIRYNQNMPLSEIRHYISLDMLETDNWCEVFNKVFTIVDKETEYKIEQAYKAGYVDGSGDHYA